MNKTACNFLLFIILLVLAVLFFGCEKDIKASVKVKKEKPPFWIEQKISRLSCGDYCLTTYVWQNEPLDIIFHSYVFEGDATFKVLNSWHVVELTDSIKKAQYSHAENIMKKHIKKITL